MKKPVLVSVSGARANVVIAGAVLCFIRRARSASKANRRRSDMRRFGRTVTDVRGGHAPVKHATRMSAQSRDWKMSAMMEMPVAVMGMKMVEVLAAVEVIAESHLRPPTEVVITPKIGGVVTVIIIWCTVIAVLAKGMAPDASDEVATGIAFFAVPIDVTPRALATEHLDVCAGRHHANDMMVDARPCAQVQIMSDDGGIGDAS